MPTYTYNISLISTTYFSRLPRVGSFLWKRTFLCFLFPTENISWCSKSGNWCTAL